MVVDTKDDVRAVGDFGAGVDSGCRFPDRPVSGRQLANVLFAAKDFQSRGIGLQDPWSRPTGDLDTPLAGRSAKERDGCAGREAPQFHSSIRFRGT